MIPKRPSLHLIIGPMFSGKTSQLIHRLSHHIVAGDRTIYINCSIDTRENSTISTHSKIIKRELPYDSIKIDADKLDTFDISNYDVIGVDEAQFFLNLKKIVTDWVDKKGKTVYISSLNSNYLKEPFGQIHEMICTCDTVTKLNAFCKRCLQGKIVSEAIFTARIVTNSNLILTGAEESYIPVCRECYSKLMGN